METSRWLGQARQKSRERPISMDPGSALMKTLGTALAIIRPQASGSAGLGARAEGWWNETARHVKMLSNRLAHGIVSQEPMLKSEAPHFDWLSYYALRIFPSH
jgi:hypothetical protein